MDFLCINAAGAKKSFHFLHAGWKRKPRIIKKEDMLSPDTGAAGKGKDL